MEKLRLTMKELVEKVKPLVTKSNSVDEMPFLDLNDL